MDATIDTRTQNLHVGCGHARLDGWLNADLYPTEATDICFDLQAEWPFATNSQCQVYGAHVVEHLAQWQIFFQQAWRVLRPDGILHIRVPYGGHPAAWWDFGHVRPWFVENFVFFQPGYSQSIGNPQHDGWQWPFAVESLDIRVSEPVARCLSYVPGRTLRSWVLPWILQGSYAIEELLVKMRPLKTEAEVRRWFTLRSPNSLLVRYVAWQHHWQRRVLPPGEEVEIQTIAVGSCLNGYA